MDADISSFVSQGIPLYAHVSDLAGTKKPYVLPVPFMNVLNGGYVYQQIHRGEKEDIAEQRG